ncbi:MAG TPA: HlyD family efflux transporter periplasmic adaptor subunit [Blastocatellia bacterium]|nr:HlyD family efflux transporter periplasmic adaptor subunit [Blastocatellia bacterium]
MKKTRTTYKKVALAAVALVSMSFVIYASRKAWPHGDSRLLPLLTTLEPTSFSLRINALGELQSAESLTIAVPPAPVDRLRIASVVPDGTHVKKGDVILEFDPAELDLKMLEHKSDLEAAIQKINKGELDSEIDKSDVVKDKKLAELELSKINEFLPRDEQIYSRRQIIEGELDQAYTSRKIVFADARLELKGQAFTLDEAILMLERKQADSKINMTEKARASLKLLAPSAGIIVYNDPGFFFGGFSLMPGRTVWIGMTLFNLVNPEKMEAKCYVLEKDAGELKVDQPALIRLDPFPDLEFTGKVKTIDKLARPIDRDSPVKYFQTIVSLDRAQPGVTKPGVKLKAQITAGQLDNVILVARSALVKKDAGFIVYLSRASGTFDETPVTLGRGDNIQVVVTDGLSAGDTIALNPPDLKRDFASGGKKDSSKERSKTQ